MAAQPQKCGFVLVRAKLGATDTHEALADRGVNVNDTDAEYSCSTADGTTTNDTIVKILRKLADAIEAGDKRVELQVDGNKIVG